MDLDTGNSKQFSLNSTVNANVFQIGYPAVKKKCHAARQTPKCRQCLETSSCNNLVMS